VDGVRRRCNSRNSCKVPEPAADWRVAGEALALHGAGFNPLARAANARLDFVVPLRLITMPPDEEVLRERLAKCLVICVKFPALCEDGRSSSGHAAISPHARTHARMRTAVQARLTYV
jgi:hypothetical protein